MEKGGFGVASELCKRPGLATERERGRGSRMGVISLK